MSTILKTFYADDLRDTIRKIFSDMDRQTQIMENRQLFEWDQKRAVAYLLHPLCDLSEIDHLI